jgi:hypothetical protein
VVQLAAQRSAIQAEPLHRQDKVTTAETAPITATPQEAGAVLLLAVVAVVEILEEMAETVLTGKA